jgi:hypothetical protein
MGVLHACAPKRTLSNVSKAAVLTVMKRTADEDSG